MTFRQSRIFTIPVNVTESITYNFDTSVITSDAKVERRRPKNVEPLARIELNGFTLTQEEVEEIYSFYQASRGTIDTFLYKSTIEYQVTNSIVNTSFDPNFSLYERGRGVRVADTPDQFYLFRSFELEYTPQAASFVGKTVPIPSNNLDPRTVSKTGIRCPFVENVSIYFDGVLENPADYTINTTTGIVTSSTTDLSTITTITWSGEYYFPVRFETDNLAFDRVGNDLYTVNGLVLSQEKIDNVLHDLIGKQYYVDHDFQSSNVNLGLPFIPAELISYSLPSLRKELDNKIENLTAFYNGTAEKITIESNVITEQEKNYLRNFFMVMKGRLNSFYYTSEPKRYSSDSFTFSSASGIDTTNNCNSQLFNYNSFELQSIMATPLEIDNKTLVVGFVNGQYTTEQFNTINIAWEELRTTLNTGLFTTPGATGSVAALATTTNTYLDLYNTQRAAVSQDLVVVYITPNQAPEYYTSSPNPRYVSKKTNEPTSTWATDYSTYLTSYLPADSLIILQVDLDGSDASITQGQNLSDQLRDAARNRSVYKDSGLLGNGGEIIKYVPNVPIDINLQSFIFGQFLLQERRTEAIVMRIKSNDLITYTNTVSLANALNDPDVFNALQQAIDEGNLVDNLGNPAPTGGVQPDGSIDPTVGGCMVYLFDKVNFKVQQVALDPGTGPGWTGGQCPGTQYNVDAKFDDGTVGGTFLSQSVFGAIDRIETTVTPATPPFFIITLDIDARNGSGVPTNFFQDAARTNIVGTEAETIDVIPLFGPNDCGDPPIEATPDDLIEVGSNIDLLTSNLGTNLPDCVIFVDIDSAEVITTTLPSSTCFFDFGMSTLDAIVKIGDGTLFLGQYAINALAASHEVNLSTDNQTVDSVFNDNNILTPSKLAAGLLAGASAEIYLIDWLNVPALLTDGQPILGGIVGKSRFDENQFNFEVRSTGELLNKPVVRKTSPKCEYIFGGSKCLLDLAGNGLQVEAEVLTFDSNTRRIVLTTTPLNSFFKFGSVFLFSGQNAGLKLSITDIIANNEFEYKGSLISPIYPGHKLLLTAFCGKDQNACKAYNNFVNFGGTPVGGNFIPGLQIITAP